MAVIKACQRANTHCSFASTIKQVSNNKNRKMNLAVCIVHTHSVSQPKQKQIHIVAYIYKCLALVFEIIHSIIVESVFELQYYRVLAFHLFAQIIE